MKFLKAHKYALILFFTSLIFHSLLFVVMIEKTGSILDLVRADDGYYELAENVLAGNGFSWSQEPPYEPNPLRTPGYIYVLAGLIGIAGVTGAAIIQMIAASLIPIFAMYVAEHVAQSRKIGLIVGSIFAIDPVLGFLSFRFYTDTLFLLLFLPSLLLTLHYAKKPQLQTLAISAALMGVATLVRPIAQYLPILIALCIVWQFWNVDLRRGLQHILVYFVIFGAILAPWVMRNITTFDTPGISAQTSFVLYTNFVPAVLSVADNKDFFEVRESFLTYEEYKGDTITLKNADEYTHKALTIMREHPTASAYIIGKSLFSFFTADGSYSFLKRLGYEPKDFLPLLIIIRLIWISITLAAVVGALRYLFVERTAWSLFLVTLVAYFALTSTIAAFGTNPRYSLPVDAIILALAAIGGMYTIRTILKKLHIKPVSNI